jgi:hypothetical protein
MLVLVENARTGAGVIKAEISKVKSEFSTSFSSYKKTMKNSLSLTRSSFSAT